MILSLIQNILIHFFGIHIPGEFAHFGQMSAEDYHRAARLAPITGETLPAGREPLAKEIADLKQNCIEDRSALGVREAAIVSVMFGCGLRREGSPP